MGPHVVKIVLQIENTNSELEESILLTGMQISVIDDEMVDCFGFAALGMAPETTEGLGISLLKPKFNLIDLYSRVTAQRITVASPQAKASLVSALRCSVKIEVPKDCLALTERYSDVQYETEAGLRSLRDEIISEAQVAVPLWLTLTRGARRGPKR